MADRKEVGLQLDNVDVAITNPDKVFFPA